MLHPMRMRIIHFGLLLALVASGSSLASAEDSIHFGSIFSESNTYHTEEAKKNLNRVVDKSHQQENLEELYPEMKDENQRLREIQQTPAAPPAYVPPKSANQLPAQSNDPHVGVIKNSEMDRHVVYFIELRPLQTATAKPIFFQPNTLNGPAARLEPGEMLKVVDTSEEFLLKLRMDRDNQGVWKQVARRKNSDPADLFTYYDWRNFETVMPNQSSMELDILVPRDMSSIPVFARPGAWTWKDCQLGSEMCLDRIDQHVEAILLDTSFAEVNDMRSRQSSMQLFYKIGYRLYDKEGMVRHKIGWIPSFFARRKIGTLPKQMLSGGSYSGFETDQERMERLSKYYVFHDNLNSENRLVSRWLKAKPGEKNEVFDNTFSYDAIIAYNSFNLNQSFLTETFKQHGVSAGLGIYIPLYVDLEVQGTFTYTMPIQQEPSDLYPSTPLFRGDQWLMYTSPVGINRLPLKFGLGFYYLTMFESQSNFGFKSFVGFQTKVALENERFWVDVRYGPTGQDFSFELSNREVGASLGIRLDPSQAYDSLTLFLDYSMTNYKSPLTNHTTDFEILSLGFRKSF